MPTNLPAECFEAEKRHKSAVSIPEKIDTLEELISTIPKHKGTDKLRAGLRKKLSKLKSAGQSKKGAAKQKSIYNIDGEGAGQVLLIGAPNTGKSSILNHLTNASPRIDVFPQTTWEPTPGMMPYRDIAVQLIDTPPVTPDYTDPEFFNLVFRADLILMVLDIQGHPERELKQPLQKLLEHRIAPLHQREKYSEDPKMRFKPLLLVLNKYDTPEMEEVVELFQILLEEEWPMQRLSIKTGEGVDAFRKRIFDELEVIRVYAKSPGKKADLEKPFVLKKGQTVADFATQVHREIAEGLKSARIWGTGVYDGQAVQRDHALHDGDVVELHT